MADKKMVFLYELASKKVYTFTSQIKAGKYLGVSEACIRLYKDTLKVIRGYYIVSDVKILEGLVDLVNEIDIYESNNEQPIKIQDNTNVSSVLDDRLEELGYSKDAVHSVKTWQNASGDTRFSIVTKPNQINSEEFLERLSERLIENITPMSVEEYKVPVKMSGVDLIVYTSDKHVGASSKDSQYDNEYNSKIFSSRMENIYKEIMYVKFEFGTINKLIFIDLGDNLDGYQGQTTRGGHALPQNMTNEESFDTYVNVHCNFFTSLVENKVAAEYDVVFVNDSNHSGSFGYTANRALEIYLNTKYPFIYTRQMNKFMEHFILGNDVYILCHGKDKIDRKNGLPLHLNDATYKLISDYIDYNELNNYNINFVKGDLHQATYEKNTKFSYRNIPSVYGASKWIMNNFGLNKPGFSMDVYHMGNIYRRDVEL